MKIKTENITKNFNSHTVLNKINIKIEPGKTTVVIGPNGAGKTTLLKIIDMIENQTSGEIYYNQKPQSALSTKEKLKLRRKMVYVSQFPVVFSGTVLENLFYVFRIRKVQNSAEMQSKLANVLELLQIEHLQEKFAKNLSYGEKQRIALARALLTNPEILLLDEPTNNLDPLSTKIVENIIEHLMKAEKTIILTTHNLLFARKFAQYLYFIQNGKIIQEGTPEEVFSKPFSVSTAEFVGIENIIKGKVIDNSKFVTGNNEIYIIADNSLIGKEIYASIRPEDIMISNEPIVNTSARNCLKGEIVEIKNIGIVEEIKVYISKNLFLTTIITGYSKDHLCLSVGKQIYLIFKATAVNLLTE